MGTFLHVFCEQSPDLLSFQVVNADLHKSCLYQIELDFCFFFYFEGIRIIMEIIFPFLDILVIVCSQFNNDKIFLCFRELLITKICG